MSEPKQGSRPLCWADMNPGRFIHPDKLADKDVTLTIKDFIFEEMVTGKDKRTGKEKKEVKCLLHFKETDLLMKVNKTNQECLRGMFGGKPKDAIGKRVTLKKATARFASEIHPCIRFRGSPDIKAPVVVTIKKRAFGGDIC